MEKRKIELFVPGRLCIIGEHSDWAGRYRTINHDVEKGYAIVTGIEEGIYATVKPAEKFIVRYEHDASKKFSINMDYNELAKIASEGGYWCYVAGVASSVKEHYNVGGLEIIINNVTLPEKKGLSSSAAICVLVARAFNQMYNLHFSTIGEMTLAYNGEIATPSRCGKLDQACAFGKKPVLLSFDGDAIKVEPIKVGEDLFFVFADLKAKKDTIKILGDLNRSYPFAKTDVDFKVHEGLGTINKKIVFEAIEYIKDGNAKKLGKLLSYTQEIFDEYIAPACPEELTSPLLHKTLNNDFIRSNTYGGKGVGSQGDGTIQFLAKDEETQLLVKEYIENELHMDSYILTIPQTKPIKKAIIPVAGNGTRMYPITKLLKKAFIPIIDDDGILKPAIMSLLEELDDAGLEEICLIIDRNDQTYYDDFFTKNLTEEVTNKLSPAMLDYESKIQKIGKKLKFIYQEEKLGLGHAVSLCEKFVGDDNCLLVLGDQLYKTNQNNSCTIQLLENFRKTGKLTVSVFEVPLNEVSKYGILTGRREEDCDYFNVEKMSEKPESSYAEEYLYTLYQNEKKYYSVFGEYILTPYVFKKLKENINNGYKENGEYQLTSVLDSVKDKTGMIAFVPDGEMLDIGNVESYKKTLIKKMKK